MRPLWLLLVAMLAVPVASPAQELPIGFDESFAAASIPAGLAGDAPVVVRLYDHSFTIRDSRRSTERVRRVVTVLGPEGRNEGVAVVPYDKFSSIRRFEGQIRDASGRVVRRLRRSELGDYSAISGFSLYEDVRVRTAELYHDVYPYTVELEYEVEHSGSLFYPSWYPQETSAPVQLARFTVERPATVPIRYHTHRLAVEPEVSEARGRRHYRWQVANLPTWRPEPGGPAWSEQMGAVHTAPVEFVIEGTNGSMASWSEFAGWYHRLGEGRQRLPADAEAQVRQLVATIEDDREKVRVLYRFMQEKTRYVSVQLGLGGWQPFDARYVHERSYGDCKALTNYLQALLRVAGIEAFPALIYSGVRHAGVDPDFPRNAFNHAILYVPLGQDAVWLEATSRTAPFGHIGAFNEDRWALVVRPGGGELVRTPRSTAEQNRQARRATVRLRADGNAAAEVETRFTGNQQDRVRDALVEASARDRERWLHDEIGLSSFRVVAADYSSFEARSEEPALALRLELPRHAARTGSRLFLQPNLMERATYVPPPMTRRTQPVQLSYAYLDEDEVVYELPEGFRLEAAPEPVQLEAAFGSFHAATEVTQEGHLRYSRRLELSEAVIPAEQYEAYRAFWSAVVQADRAQAVLVAE
jgi:hypothetical protein